MKNDKSRGVLWLFPLFEKAALLLLLVSLSTLLFAQKNIQVSSPDAKLRFVFTTSNGQPNYSVYYLNKKIIDNSLLNVDIENKGMLRKAVVSKTPVFKNVNENYKLVTGKASLVNNRYRQVSISLKDAIKNDLGFDLEIRAFNDGLAFRYVFPGKGKEDSFVLSDEKTEFRFVADPIVKALVLPNYTSSHEGLYSTSLLSTLKEDTLMDMPALFHFADSTFVAITEAALVDYAGMYLVKTKGIINAALSPLPSQGGIKVKAKLPHASPWRVLMISNQLGTLLESNILTSLNEPSAVKDISWLKPGTSNFPWWYGTIVPDSIKGGNNFETNKYFIDFCAANKIDYHTIVEYGGHEWYSNDGGGYQPGNNVDVTKPVAGLDMKQICDYGKSKNVGIRVWVHWKALYPRLEEAFTIFEKWGLSGMMVDFMDRDDQEMVNIQNEILEKAAAHHLHIQFHGAYKPTGLNRTWPNEFTREGTLNYEHHKWDNLVSPDADMNIVFTRLLAGSTDYHLGGFRALPYDKFVVQNEKPYVIGTRCHMLAMYVVLENALSMICDDPAAYINQPGFEVLQNMPTVWDETKVPAAALDQFVTIARRSKDSWYIASITNNDARKIPVNFSFLPPGKYTGYVYSDAATSHIDANQLTKKTVNIDSKTILDIEMAPGGGNLIIIKKNVQ